MTTTEETSMIAIAFPTIMSGLVVRWYADADAWQAGNESASASRERAMQYVDDADLAALTQDVHLRIKRDGHDADLSDVLTHKPAHLLGNELVPLTDRTPAARESETE